jgi:hypothetical protein
VRHRLTRAVAEFEPDKAGDDGPPASIS